MLRLICTQAVYELWTCARSVAYCGTKAKSVLPPGLTRACGTHGLFRHYRTGDRLRKDGLQPEADESDQGEDIDLDKWKAVMKSKMMEKAKDGSQREETSRGGEEGPGGPEVDLKAPSLLETTRELVTMWRHAGKLVPQEMTDEEVQALADLSTKSSKKKYLKFLAVKEGHRRHRKEKQERTKAQRDAARAPEGDAREDGGAKNTFLLQFWDRSLDKLLGWRCAQAMVFDQPLVFDMSYEANMSKREVDNAVSQLMDVEGWNRRAAEPFHLHYCNLQPGGAYARELLKRYGAEAWSRLLVTCTDREHVQVFPRERLVYLTADSPNVLRAFDPSKVYVVGALVDRSIQSGLTLANAKRLKLATARLPLDEFLHWEMGAKNLTLDQMIRIMLALKETGKWEEALKFVPRRKHDGFGHGETAPRRAGGGARDGGARLKPGRQTVQREGQRQPGGSGKDGKAGDRGTPAVTRRRTSFKSDMEGRKGRTKMWWEDD